MGSTRQPYRPMTGLQWNLSSATHRHEHRWCDKPFASTCPGRLCPRCLQCRNPIHKAHYELFIRALDAPNVGEGAVVLVHPTCGPTQARIALTRISAAVILHLHVSTSVLWMIAQDCAADHAHGQCRSRARCPVRAPHGADRCVGIRPVAACRWLWTLYRTRECKAKDVMHVRMPSVDAVIIWPWAQSRHRNFRYGQSRFPMLLHAQDDDIPGIVRYRTYEVLAAEVDNPRLRWAYLPYSMHMAGPREAIQHMIIRRNYGCALGHLRVALSSSAGLTSFRNAFTGCA